ERSSALLGEILEHRHEDSSADAGSLVCKLGHEGVSQTDVDRRQRLVDRRNSRDQLRSRDLREHAANAVEDPASQRVEQLNLKGLKVLASRLVRSLHPGTQVIRNHELQDLAELPLSRDSRSWPLWTTPNLTTDRNCVSSF